MAGVVAWVISKKVQGIDVEPRPEEIVEWKSQLMGYASAMLYCKQLLSLWIIVLMVFPKWGHVYRKYVSEGATTKESRLRRDQ